ncbi:MAG: thiamine pyrophosphate-dependent enzyme, partial [Chloroflexota bacterium]
HEALQAPIDRATWTIEPGRVDPREAAEVMDELLPVDIPLIVGGGHFVSFPVMHMTKPGRPNITTVQWGCIGQGVGTAIGAGVAYGGRPTLLVDGDASAMMHIQEMDTAVRYKLPLLLVVDNDEALGAEYHKLRAHDLNADLAAIPSPDFATLGRGFGCRGKLVRSIPELREALTEFVRDPLPTIIDLRVSRQVVSQAYRRLHFGEFD